MRPSARHVAAIGRLNVPGRSASPYICTRCLLATQRARLAPSRSSNGFVRHASSDKPPEKEKIQLTERFRRKIWGTDNPPGQKDPYSKASPEERARMEEEERLLQEEEAREAKTRRSWFGRKNEEPSVPPEQSEAPARTKNNEGLTPSQEMMATTQEAVEEHDVDPNAPIMIPTTEEAEEFGYVPAATWDGLPRVGVKHDATRELQAFMNENPFIPYIGSRKLRPSSAPRVVKQALSAVLSQQDAEPLETEPGEAETSQVEQIMDQWTAADGTIYRMAGETRSGERPWTAFDISQDLHLKFSLIKQVMRLGKTRIPDPAIAEFKTVGDIVRYLEIPPQPTALVDLLLQNPQLRALPNLEIKRRTRTRTKIDDEFGWHKEIRKELKSRDLLGKRPQVVNR